MHRAMAMRFVQDVHDGTIGAQEFADYLTIEASFVSTATRLHGYAVWDAPDQEAMDRNAQAAYALVTEQADYFRNAVTAWPMPATDGAAERAEVLSDFAVTAARDGGYAAITTIMFAAESLYLSWCTSAHLGGRPPTGPIADWVALHATEAFAAGVDALARQVDALPETDTDEQLERWFEGMLEAEIAFHDAVYR